MRTAILAVTVFLLARTRLRVSAWPQHIHPVGISAEELAALLTGDTSTAGARPLSAPPAPSADSPQPASPADTSHISDEDLISLIAGGLPETDAPATVPPSFPLTSDSTPSSTGCSCVNSWQCPETNIENSKGLEEEREALTLPETDGLFALVNLRHTALCPGLMVCCDAPDFSIVEPPLPPPRTPKCGAANPNGVMTKFLGFEDNQAQFGQFPWMAAIRTLRPFSDDPMYGYIGGGSLIHPGIVMTAAHKLRKRNPKNLVVRLGEWDFSSTSETIEYQEIPLKRVEYHPQYSFNTLKYDVALLYLETEVVLGPTVDTICLPEHEHDFSAACATSGWGKDSFGQAGKYQEILKSIELPAMSHRQCEDALRTTRLGPTFSLDETFMCAGGVKGQDLCTGDGGSPLVCQSLHDPTRYVQVGISAWGIGCGEDGIPGVYASVIAAMPWINAQLLEMGPSFDIRNAFV